MSAYGMYQAYMLSLTCNYGNTISALSNLHAPEYYLLLSATKFESVSTSF